MKKSQQIQDLKQIHLLISLAKMNNKKTNLLLINPEKYLMLYPPSHRHPEQLILLNHKNPFTKNKTLRSSLLRKNPAKILNCKKLNSLATVSLMMSQMKLLTRVKTKSLAKILFFCLRLLKRRHMKKHLCQILLKSSHSKKHLYQN